MLPAGVYAPIPTPFDAAGEIDRARLKAALQRWLAAPLTGLVILGSNGEAALLDDHESDRLIGWARDAVPRGRPMIVGTGRESTRATIAASKRAAAAGADAVLVRTPGFFKTQMSTDVLVTHYLAVADESPAPVVLYNFTAVTGVNLAPAAVSRLAPHPNIVGVKESGGDVAQIAEFVSSVPPPFRVFAGSATSFYASLCVGASGGVLALACVVPDACVQLFDLTAARRHEEARTLQQRLAPLARLIGARYGVAGLKAALALQGCDVGPPRLPLAPVDAAGLTALTAALTALEDLAA
jgi:4-hydroxy-2-oxoglutarate aldolase